MGPGRYKRVQRGEVFEARGLIAPQDVAHAVRLKLEDRRGVAAREKLISSHVVQRQRVQIDLLAAVLLDQLHGVVEHGERGQPQKIHLQQAEALERLHVVLRRDFIAVGLVNGNEIR